MCDLDPRRLARIYDPVHRLKLSYEAYYVVKQCERKSTTPYGAGSLKYKPLKYSQRSRPQFSQQKVAFNLKPAPTFSYKPVEFKANSCSPGFRDNTKGRPNYQSAVQVWPSTYCHCQSFGQLRLIAWLKPLRFVKRMTTFFTPRNRQVLKRKSV